MKNTLIAALVCGALAGCGAAMEDEQIYIGTADQALAYPNQKHTDNKHVHESVAGNWSGQFSVTGYVAAFTYYNSIAGTLGIDITADAVNGNASTDLLGGDVTSTITQIGRTTCNESGTGQHIRMNHCGVTVSVPSFNTWCSGQSDATKANAMKGLFIRQWAAGLGLQIPADGTGSCTGTVMQSHTCGCASMATAAAGGLSTTEKAQLATVIALDANSAEL